MFFDISWMLVGVEPSGNPLVDWLANSGAVGILAFIVVAFIMGWIVPGGEAKRLREERDQALKIVFELSKVSNQSLDIAEKVRE